MMDNAFFNRFVVPGTGPILSARLLPFEPARPPWPAHAPLVLLAIAPRLLDPTVADPTAAQLT